MTRPSGNSWALADVGLIEGFYGRPFSHEERVSLVRFAGGCGFSCYVYAPKHDPLHRDRWRERYGRAELDRFRELARAGAEHGVRLVYGLAPGLTYDSSESDFALLATKIRDVVGAGVGGIALLFDDLGPDSATLDPVQQAIVIARTAELVAEIDRALSFWFIGNFYCGDAAELRAGTGFWSALYRRSATEYFAAYETHVPAGVPIMWTGPAVFSARLAERDAAEFRALARRPVVLWDNFPVNDTLPGQIFLGPYAGREAGALSSLHGIVLNLMPQAWANRIPLATAAEFFANPTGYDADEALRRAIASMSVDPPARRHVETLVEQLRGHPVLSSSDTALELHRLTVAAFGDSAPDAEAVTALRRHLEVLAENQNDLRRSLGAHDLLEEIEPWSHQLTRLARAALTGMAAIEGRASAEEYADAIALARQHDHVVGATRLPSALTPFVAGHGEPVDRFAELFAAIDGRLGAVAS